MYPREMGDRHWLVPLLFVLIVFVLSFAVSHNGSYVKRQGLRSLKDLGAQEVGFPLLRPTSGKEQEALGT
ncbi:hypothetical protein, partial [Halorhodospira abdelmalekii]|uniref:hypothetical protein n=1 Tax=Halorhodospira abdelmalekii TaxID=421629 RepID=UPI001A90DE57